MTVTFHVLGLPQAKGSARAFTPKGWNRPVITSTCKGLKGWEQNIRSEAQRLGRFFPDGPLTLRVRFDLPRPKSLPKKVTSHTKRPDLDKLTRAVGDALTGVLWRDDSQVVSIEASKWYAEGPSGALITVEGA
jgi:crossover junction endodeoxyribonuclease RusA